MGITHIALQYGHRPPQLSTGEIATVLFLLALMAVHTVAVYRVARLLEKN